MKDKPLETRVVNAIPTESIVEKLEDLRRYMPGGEDTLYIFGKYLAERVKGYSTLVPIGFYSVAEIALYDLHKGTDRVTTQPITENGLIGQSPIVYQQLLEKVPAIARAVCPEDFATKVYEEFEARKEQGRMSKFQ